jgi:hypothetical protein
MTIYLAQDMPDDYDWLPGSARFPLADMGELAVRLGSPVTFDRRGEVIWLDVGDKGLAPYAVGGGGTGNMVKVKSIYTLHGHYTLQLTAGSDGIWNSNIGKMMSNISMRRAGLEAAYCLLTPCQYFTIHLLRYTGAQLQQGSLRANYTLQELQYFGDDGNYHTIAPIDLGADPYGLYHHSKLTVDYDAGYYKWALFDEAEYDLSAYPLYEFPDLAVAHYWIAVTLVGRNTFNDTALIGHVILTGNEP